MEIVDDENRFLTQYFNLNDTDPLNYNLDFVKEMVFVDTGNFKYHPVFTNIYSCSEDNKQCSIVSVIDILEKEKKNITSKEYQDQMYNNLSKDFKSLNPDLYLYILKLLFEPDSEDSKEFVKNMISTIPEFKKNIDSYIRKLGGIQTPRSMTSDNWSKASSDSDIYDSEGSDTYDGPSLRDLIEKLEQEKKVEKETGVSEIKNDININILSYQLIVTKPRDRDIELENIFNNTRITKNLLAIGMVIGGEPRFKRAKVDDKNISREIDIFIKSEHIKDAVKYLKPGILYFMYKSPRSIIYGTLSDTGAMVIKIKPIGLQYKDFDKHVEDSKKYGNDIVNIFGSKFFIINESISVYNISVKIIKKGIYYNLDFIKELYKGKVDRTMVRFSLDKARNIIYSSKNGDSNFTFFNLTPGSLEEGIKSIRWHLKNYKGITSTPIIKKEDIKNLEGGGINTNSRECQKPRRPNILRSGQVVPEGIYTMEYNGKIISCNKNYPWPGFTKKSAIPCCFKKNQEGKSVFISNNQKAEIVKIPDDSLQNRHVMTKILERNVLEKDNINMERYRRGKLSNKALRSIFGDNFHSLSPGLKSGILDAIRFIYGNDIVSESVDNIDQEWFQRLNINETQTLKQWKEDQNKTTESIIKAVSIYKKINPLVVMETSKGTEVVCSMTEYFTHNQYIILIRNEDTNTTNILTRYTQGQVLYELTYDNPEIQEMVKLYNRSCHSPEKCKYHIMNLYEMKRRKGVEIISQVVNSLNRVYYLETNHGILPIIPSIIDYTIASKTLSDIIPLNKINQYELLEKISKKIPYLKPKAKVQNNGEEKISGIELQCGMVSPVLDEEKKLPESVPLSDANFYFEIDDILKSDIISDEELRIFKENLEENYYNIAKRVLASYYKNNTAEKRALNKMINDQEYDNLIQTIGRLFIREVVDISKESLPLEETMPMKINDQVFDNVVSRLVFSMINELDLFFNEKEKAKVRVDIQFIPNDEEISISLQ